jgi:hypothetical protein
MKTHIFLVEEWNVDGDDYQMGDKRLITATCNQDRAVALAREPARPSYSKTVRGWRSIVVEDFEDANPV